MNNLLPNYDPKSTMGDDEFAIQLIKIFLAFVFGITICIILMHINHNLTTIIVQNGEKMK